MQIVTSRVRLRRLALVGSLLLMILGFSTQSWAIGKGDAPPDFSLPDTAGNTVTLSQFKGKVVVVNFFTVTCQPCRHEMPVLSAIYKVIHAEGLVRRGICLNVDPNQLKVFAKQMNVAYPFLVGTDKVSKDYGEIVAVPTTFIINREGKITEKIEGARKKEEFMKLIGPLL